jgi:hypothetical protein
MHVPFPEYVGMSYEQASREGERLVDRHGWFQSWDRLEVLRIIMLLEREREREAA